MGKVSKLQYAKYIAASLAYMALQQHDPVGLIAFDSKVRSYGPPPAAPAAWAPSCIARWPWPAAAPTSAESLRQLREHCQRRGLVVVISDLSASPRPSPAPCSRWPGAATTS